MDCFVLRRLFLWKIYKTMGSTGAASLAVGICVLTGGIAAGILLIVNGARLLKNRAKMIF